MPVPADHSTTVNTIGYWDTFKIIVNAIFNYRNTMFHFLRHRQFKRLANFLYTKTLVPTGEGSGELAYYFIGGILQKYPQLAPYPKYIEIEVTTKCDKKCIICEHTWWNERSRDLHFDEFKKLVDQFDLRWVNLTGEGDAFLNKDYLNMISYCKSKDMSVYLTDSFDLITPDISEKLVAMGVDGIYLSMDGANKKTYEKIKAGCDFDRTIHNVIAIIEEKQRQNTPIPELCLRYTLVKDNLDEVADFVSLINKIATREEWGDGSKIHFIGLLDYPEIHDMYVEKIPHWVIEEAHSAIPEDGVPVVFAHLDNSKNPDINKCLAWLEPYFALVPEPMALPCCSVMMTNARDKLLEYSFGNYMTTPFKEIWNSPYYTWFRQQVTKKDGKVPMLCVGCRAYDTSKRVQQYGIDIRKSTDFQGVEENYKCPLCKGKLAKKDNHWVCNWCNIEINPDRVTNKDII
jgi:pyrroloquinoline quinone biosynthesis protein E